MRRVFAACATSLVLTACAGESTPVSSDATVVSDLTSKSTGQVTEIDLVVGESTGSAVSYTVAVGSTVRISIVNETEDDEYHLHGYDISSGEVPSGETASLELVADKAGSFELESHHSGDLLMTLVVE